MATALRRLAEEDPTLDLRRDEQTGEQLLGGLSQMHVEVAVERLKRRFGVEVELHQPRVPYLETIRKESRAQGRYKKQTGGRGQFGDCHDRARAAPGPRGLRVRGQDRRRRHPAELPAGGRQGHPGGDGARRARGRAGDRACASCSSTAPTTPSTPRRWRSRSPARWRSRAPTRRPTPCSSSRSWRSRPPSPTTRGRDQRRPQLAARPAARHGAAGAGMTTIKAEVPMAEILTYSQSLTSLTGGRGDYRCASSATRKCRRTSRRRSSRRRSASGRRRRRRDGRSC